MYTRVRICVCVDVRPYVNAPQCAHVYLLVRVCSRMYMWMCTLLWMRMHMYVHVDAHRYALGRVR